MVVGIAGEKGGGGGGLTVLRKGGLISAPPLRRDAPTKLAVQTRLISFGR